MCRRSLRIAQTQAAMLAARLAHPQAQLRGNQKMYIMSRRRRILRKPTATSSGPAVGTSGYPPLMPTMVAIANSVTTILVGRDHPSDQFIPQDPGDGPAVGSPETVRAKVHRFIERTGADEIVVSGATFDPAARRRSLELTMGAVAD